MKMDPGLDTGDILTERRTPIHPDDNSQTLHDGLAKLGAELLVDTIRDYIAGKIVPRPQPAAGATYARKISKEDGRLDWSQPARVLWNRIRAFTPWPGAFTYLPAQNRPLLLKVWQAEISDLSGAPGEILHTDKSGIVVACAKQSLKILTLQREGGRRMTAQEFLTGHPLACGQKLG
jgi:methionyl-tRNA formyltransferase